MTNSPRGLDLATLALAKGFQVCQLEKWGLCDRRVQGVLRTIIPYFNEYGTTIAVRYRLSLEGDQRFTWRRGDHVSLYGLHKLEAIRKVGWVLLVEGESDTWTGWLYDIPTLGIPGKSAWRSKWTQHLEGLEVYLWCEPQAEDLALRVSQDIPGLKVLNA